MSIETFPTAKRDAEPQVDQTTIDEINSAEPAERPELSTAGSRMVRAANRINGFLEKRAINKAHGEALAENTQRDRDTQDEAFASYEDNVTTTADRESLEDDWTAAQEAHFNEQRDEAYAINDEMDKTARREKRAEQLATAKETARSWGAAALETAKKSWTSTKSGAETAALYAMITTDKVKDAAQKAQVRAAERAAYREDFARNAYDQEVAYDSYEENIDATAERERQDAELEAEWSAAQEAHLNEQHTEALGMNEAFDANKVREAQEEAYASYESNIDATAKREARQEYMDAQHAEALDMNAEFDANTAREAALAKARAARMRQLQRQALRAQLRKQSGEVITAAGQKAKGLTKKFGRSIARFARRGASVVAGAARGAAQGARESYQNTAQ